MKTFSSSMIKTYHRCKTRLEEAEDALEKAVAKENSKWETIFHLSNDVDAFEQIVREMRKAYKGIDQTDYAEDWRSIPGFSRYMASHKGRIKYLKTGSIWKGSVNRSGYLVLNVHSDVKGSSVCRQIHVLVCLAFHGDGNPGEIADHRDEDGSKLDNRACNLQWLTQSQNIIKAAKARRERERESRGQGTLFEPEQAPTVTT